MMLIGRCVHNRGEELGVPLTGTDYALNYEFDVERGKDYPIYALGISRFALVFLVVTEIAGPSWMPHGLFELVARDVPQQWQIFIPPESERDEEFGFSMKMSYPEFLRDRAYFDRLIQGDSDACLFFYEFREALTKRNNRL
jgi:hypothetical protein